MTQGSVRRDKWAKRVWSLFNNDLLKPIQTKPPRSFSVLRNIETKDPLSLIDEEIAKANADILLKRAHKLEELRRYYQGRMHLQKVSDYQLALLLAIDLFPGMEISESLAKAGAPEKWGYDKQARLYLDVDELIQSKAVKNAYEACRYLVRRKESEWSQLANKSGKALYDRFKSIEKTWLINTKADPDFLRDLFKVINKKLT